MLLQEPHHVRGTVSQKSTSPVTSAFAAVAGSGMICHHDPVSLDVRTGRAIGQLGPRDVVDIAINTTMPALASARDIAKRPGADGVIGTEEARA